MNPRQRPGVFDEFSFTIAVTAASKILLLRDRILGKVPAQAPAAAAHCLVSRHVVTSGRARLDAVFTRPRSTPRAAVLICHGIAETVGHWRAVQLLLADHGVASLVFDYAGYGESTGTVRWRQCEADAVAAFEYLQALVPDIHPSILGFSLGSGIAAAILGRTLPRCLILCAAFTSFQDATCAVLGLPKRFAGAVPPIWNTHKSLHACTTPSLIVHGALDRLFSEQMALDLAAGCGTTARLVVMPGVHHSEPFYKPHLSYWSHVIRRLVEPIE